MKKLYFLLFLFFSFFSSHIYSQDTTNMGTEFWVGYGHHQFMEAGSNTQEMTLYISTGSQPALVTISIDSSGPAASLWWRRTYSIPAQTVISIDNYPATSFTTVAGASGPLPKSGSADSRLISQAPPAGTGSVGIFRKKGISIMSDVPVAVYSHIYGSASSGASMLLPLQAWGYTYYGINNAQKYASNTFAWMYIVAREDSTVIEITPSAKTRSQNVTGLQPGVATTVVLQKGHIYQLLGANTSSDANGNGGTATTGFELTGTKVRALVRGRPVAVYSGSSRTTGAASCGSGGGDNDMVQLFPLHIWGRRYLTAPQPTSSGASVFSTSTYKIIVNDPTTVVVRNGSVLAPGLIPNNSYIVESNTADFIQADKPIMVAQFMNGGAGCIPGSMGDPDMYYLSPMDAGVKEVTTIRTTKEAISINYVTLVIPTAALSSLRIDGSAVFDHTYSHPNYPYHTVVVKRWTAAMQQVNIKADSTFTGLAYGIGSVESYGFNLGAKFRPIHGLDPMYRLRWTGAADTNWFNENNWSNGHVPAVNEHILVPAGAANQLIIPDGVEVTVKSIELQPGASMRVGQDAKVNVRE